MQYFIIRGEQVRGPISHEQLMALAKRKELKKSDLIATSKDGPYELLAVAWDVIKRSESNGPKTNFKDSAESNLYTKTENLKSIFVAILEDIANPSNKAKYISISSTIAGLFAFLFLRFTFLSALFSIAGIIFGCVAILGFKKYRPAGYIGICICFLAFIFSVSAVNDRRIAEQKQKIAEQKQLEYGNHLNQEEAKARAAIYKSNKPRLKAELEKAKAEKENKPRETPKEGDEFQEIELTLVSKAKAAIKKIDPTASFGWFASDNFRWIRVNPIKRDHYYVGKVEGTVEVFGTKVPKHWHVELEKRGQTWTVVRCEVN